MALRFNEERPGHTMLIAGHTDSVGGEAGNQTLSEQRAELVHAVLMGERDKFAEIAQATHKVSDYKQILKWASVTLSGLEPPEGAASQSGAEAPGGAGGPQPAASPGGAGSPDAEPSAHDFAACDPGLIDDVAFTGIEPLKAFQRAYNANKPALGAAAADVTVDGSIGPKTWGAIFDCYQFNMAQELGEVDDEADESNPTKLLEGLDKLRGLVTFVALDEEFIGFGEAHPADGNRRDGAASQENRRVELLFFESGQEPDVAILKEAPEITELYSPDAFVRQGIEGGSAKPGVFVLHDLVVPIVQDPDRDPEMHTGLELTGAGGRTWSLEPGMEDVLHDEETETLSFHFRELPAGRYDLFVVVGDYKHRIVRGLRVAKAGVFVEGQLLDYPARHEPPEALELEERPGGAPGEITEPPFC